MITLLCRTKWNSVCLCVCVVLSGLDNKDNKTKSSSGREKYSKRHWRKFFTSSEVLSPPSFEWAQSRSAARDILPRLHTAATNAMRVWTKTGSSEWNSVTPCEAADVLHSKQQSFLCYFSFVRVKILSFASCDIWTRPLSAATIKNTTSIQKAGAEKYWKSIFCELVFIFSVLKKSFRVWTKRARKEEKSADRMNRNEMKYLRQQQREMMMRNEWKMKERTVNYDVIAFLFA